MAFIKCQYTNDYLLTLRKTFTDILSCSSNSPINVGIRYSDFNGFSETSVSKNSLKPSSSTSKKSSVNPHIFIDTNESMVTAK